MAQCLKISFSLGDSRDLLNKKILKHARRLELEGIAQSINSHEVRIVVCGSKEAMEEFVDLVYKEVMAKAAENLEIEPFIKERDYRGVFRVIE